MSSRCERSAEPRARQQAWQGARQGVCFTMKRLVRIALGVALGLAAATRASAATVPTLPFAGRLTDANGTPLNSAGLSITVRLFPTTSGGTVLWAQTYGVPLSDGRFAIDI